VHFNQNLFFQQSRAALLETCRFEFKQVAPQIKKKKGRSFERPFCLKYSADDRSEVFD